MLNASSQLLMASAVRKNPNKTALTFITGLKYNASLLKTINNLTFIFDPNWEYEAGNPTYPLAFFHLVKMTEVMESEVSQRPVLFYSSNSASGTNVSAGLTNVISDNIIIKPKTYRLDILVPMNMDNFFNGGYFANIASVEAFTLGSKHEPLGQVGSTIFNIATKTIDIIGNLITALYGTELNASSIVTALCGQKDYNKNSIEYMWRNRRIIKLKLWTGWSFKYLVIQSCDITKTGENGDYFEGTLVCQEVPIITMKPSSKEVKMSALSSLSAAVGTLMKKGVSKFIDLMESSFTQD